MRVYYIGAHSTGKTTMVRYTAQQYRLPLLTEVARALLAEKEITLDRLRSDIQAVNVYQRGVFDRQILEEGGKEHFVSDRSFDNLAYAASHSTILRQILQDNKTAEYVETLRKKDVALFFIRPSKAILFNDGVREKVEWDDLVSIDAMIKFMLEMWGLKYFQISTSSMQERIRLVDSVLGTMVRNEMENRDERDDQDC